jgi:2-polyprenyl-3-methyl-5-hydroxy-6-metoxy-1,4-benzoquinol methylase
MKIALYLPEVFEPQEDGYNQVDISSIGELDDAAYEEILVSDNLDFVDDRDAFTDEIVKKIRYGGKVVFSGVDIFEVARGIIGRNIQAQDINQILYLRRCSVSNVFDICKKLSSLGLKIINKRINNYRYTVIAERPSPDA